MQTCSNIQEHHEMFHYSARIRDLTVLQKATERGDASVARDSMGLGEGSVVVVAAHVATDSREGVWQKLAILTETNTTIQQIRSAGLQKSTNVELAPDRFACPFLPPTNQLSGGGMRRNYRLLEFCDSQDCAGAPLWILCRTCDSSQRLRDQK
ncbi:hypothetical protein FKP32DRAFT_222823 [Trametes sanguinea]|nr:hypothetical protein FKP32DRAFT_222823 [Trametes sanguinea]